MTTTRNQETTRTKLVYAALVLGAVLVAGGCASSAPFKPSFAAAYTFTIPFVNGCPGVPQVDNPNCDASRPKDCLRARKGEKVTFQASPQTSEFELQFGPFKETSLKSHGGTVILVIDAPSNPNKAYPYNIGSGTCPPVDPRIIVE